MKRSFTLLCAVATAHGLDNGLGKLPGLGWNSDYCVNCSKNADGFQNEAFIKGLAKYMHTHVLPCGKTFQQLGYRYLNMDASWNLKTRSASGQLQPDPALWPSGLNNTVDYVHSLGLGFGLYGDRGMKDCAGNPGAEGHVTADAEFMARNKIDWYKEDSCDNDTPTQEGAIAQYAQMRDALNKTGRPIWFALCGWEPWYASNPLGGKRVGNSARTGPDTGQGWQSVITNTNNAASVSAYSGPTESGGYWNDGSLMLCPGYINGGGVAPPEKRITNERHRSQFNLWCILALNILLTGNLPELNSYVIDTWTNEELLAVNQDPLGVAGVKLPIETNSTVSATLTKASVAECGGEPDLQKWVVNWGLPGFIHNDISNTCLNVADCKTDVIYDSCVTNGSTCGGGEGSYHPNEEWVLTSDYQLRSNITNSPCATLQKDGSITMEPCQVPVPSNQFWNHTKQGGPIVTSTGMCLTASATPSNEMTMIIGRPLQGGSFALVFLNDDATSTSKNITCGPECISKLGASPGYQVRDLWLHAPVGEVTQNGFTAEVQGGGSSRVFKLTKPTTAE